MAQRRSLTTGLGLPNPVDAAVAQEFVYGGADAPARPERKAPTPQPSPPTPPKRHRVSITTRIREDFAAALKRASLERQLGGIEPSSLQEILEQAIEPWLKDNGYWS